MRDNPQLDPGDVERNKPYAIAGHLDAPRSVQPMVQSNIGSVSGSGSFAASMPSAAKVQDHHAMGLAIIGSIWPAAGQSRATIQRWAWNKTIYRSLVALALLVVIGGPAAAAEKAKPAQVPVSPLALQILNRACAVLSSAKAFSYHADIVYDTVLPSDLKLQFAAAWMSPFNALIALRSVTRATWAQSGYGTTARQ